MTTVPATFSRVEDVSAAIAEILASDARISCLAHKDADADSLGSALAFAQSLRAQGHSVAVTVPSPMPMLLQHLPGYDTVSLTPPADTDVLFAFDSASLARFGDQREWARSLPRIINVDHHISNEAFGEINLVEPEACATGMVVHRLLTALDIPIPADAATNLYAAILTDTGGFRHENTDERTLRLAADLAALGANPGWVAMKSYQWRSQRQVKLEGLAIAELASELDGRLVWSSVTQAMLELAGSADMQESEGVIDHLQGIDTMLLAVLLKEIAGDRTKISVRSRGNFDASAVCRPFGGGGHLRAAGAELEMPLAQATEAVLGVARGLLRATP